jgi:hypothetical protein
MNTDIIYQNKYNKYKNKYLFLKYNLTGAGIKEEYDERITYIINELIPKNFQIMLQKIQIILYNYFKYAGQIGLNNMIYSHLIHNSGGAGNDYDHAHGCYACLRWDANIKISTIKTYLNQKQQPIYLTYINDINFKKIIKLITEYSGNDDRIDDIFKYNIKLNIILYFITLISPIFTASNTYIDKLNAISKILNDYLDILNKTKSIQFNKNKDLNDLLVPGVNGSLSII